ncbi:MAG: RNA polymerase sigma factor [Sphingomonadaceae bacterium]|nr:RNA polymerase sigma factor [Sphingomonadaceae bacterium]
MNFEQLYRTHFAEVRRFALYLTGNQAEADDIAAETFVRAWAADAPLKARSLSAYLLSVARNLHRRGHRRRLLLAAFGREAPEEAPGLERELAGRSELQAILARLQLLPEIDRAALLMRAFHELSYEEIAAALGLSAAAARVKVHRARNLLKDRESPS